MEHWLIVENMKYSMQLRVYVQAYKANLDVKSFEEALKE
jgi:hypothetical protein